MMPAFSHRISQALTQREEQGLTRKLLAHQGVNQGKLLHHGQAYVHFSGNDYLGLASSAELVQAWQQGLTLWGAGSGASPMVTGFSSIHQELIRELCDWLGYEDGVLFNSGFSANQATLFALLEATDTLVQDKLNHASLMEAGMLSQATMKRFKHNDVAHLDRLLSDNLCNPLVVTEGVFSMDGDKAPLQSIATVCQNKAWWMVDDAHGIGVHGDMGAGSCALAGVKPDILVVTFGKAFGLSGAAVLTRRDVADYLAQFARHHVYSTAMPPAQAHALLHATHMIQTQQWRRDRLATLQQVYHDTFHRLPGYVATDTPIKPFLIGESECALRLATRLRERGYWLTAIRPPTVPQGMARLRITLTADHSPQDIVGLGRALEQLLEEGV